jgi:3-oxoacyl-(acyl-carrier-protein) synthase
MICPHDTGTQTQARAERTFLTETFPNPTIDLCLLKPFVGHTVGASGLLESVILLAFMREGMTPPNLGSTSGTGDFPAPLDSLPLSGPVFKLAHGMGGHNALAVFQTES